MTVQQAAEVAIPHGLCRHTVLVGGICPLPQALPGHKEESLIAAVVNLRNVHRAPDRDTKLVTVQVGRLGERILPAARDADAAVADGFKQGAVELVGAALAAEDDRDRLGEFRRGVIRLDVQFLESIQSGNTAEIPSFPDFVYRGAIEERHRGIRPHTVGLRNAGRVYAGHRGEKRLIVPAVNRELFDSLPLQRVTQRGIRRRDHECDGLDFDLCRRLSHLQRQINRCILLHLNREVGLVLLHARRLG